MKLRTKFAIVLLVITLVLSGVTYGGLELFKKQTIEQSQRNVDESAQLAANQISNSIEERKDYIGYVASRPETADFGTATETATGVVTNSRFFAAQVIAANGTVVEFRGQINSTVREDTVGSDLSDTTYFRRALNQSAYLSAPEYVEARDNYLVVISAPIIENGTTKGVFAASIFLTDDTVYSGITPLETDSQAITIYSNDTVLYETGGEFAKATTASSPIEGTEWTIWIERDQSRVSDRLINLALAQGLGLGLILVSVVGLGAWEYRANLRQTERLLSGFEALRDGDYDHRMEMATGEEWEQISDGYNMMAASLRDREQAIREREERLGVLNRVLRHNLRNELLVIMGHAETIPDRTDDDQLAASARTIVESAERLQTTGEKARDLEHRMSEVEAATRPIDMAPNVRAVLDDLTAEHPDVETTLSVPEELWIRGLPAVERAIAYVCENAFIHNDADEPVVAVSAERTDGDDGGHVRLTVSDNGPGISEHERDVITEGYETALKHGSGLGLWVSNWIVQKVGGDIAFEVAEPTGTTVILTFDAADPDA